MKTLTNLQIYNMFVEINDDCAKTGETVMPLNSSLKSINFYANQMENLEFNKQQIDKFVTFLQENG